MPINTNILPFNLIRCTAYTQFPYPTAALIAIPLRTPSPTPAVPTTPLRTTYLPLLTTYLSLRTDIVPPAVPIRSACHALHSTYCANHPAARTDRASIHHIRTAARTDPVRRYDISTAAYIIPHACRAHHSAAHLFNLVSALYFH